MKALRIILRVLKILVGLHDYASQKKHEKEQPESSNCKCQTQMDSASSPTMDSASKDSLNSNPSSLNHHDRHSTNPSLHVK